ncbi:MAG: class I SAM-dependent methyltransferase [Candidatus Eremiobacteraeota bacterium]|nr:class I SAM-dependent methyltransferase [Candidatus Eremiobacteraeota bacterium]
MDFHSEVETLESVAERFDSANDFDAQYQRFFGRIVGERLVGKVCLELGCGSGVMSEVLARYVAALDMVDGSESYLARAREKVRGKEVRFFNSLFESFEPDRRYDAIVASHVLEHVEDPVAILVRMKSWLRPSGVVFAFVPNANSIHRLLGVAMGLAENVYELSERDRLVNHRRVYDAASLAADVRAAGLEPGTLCGVLVKPLHNAMMESLPQALIDGFLELGRRIPQYAADIYYECKLP